MKYRILVIDDQEEIAVVLKEYLDDFGFLVQVALNGRKAIEKVRANKFHALLTDYKLPDMDGIKVVEECEKISPKLKVIFITGYKLKLSQLKNKRGQDIQIIEKPCRPKKILEELRKLLMDDKVK